MTVTTRLRLRTIAILDEGAFSGVLWDGVPIAVALERTFEDRRVVIPAGFSLCTRDWFHRGGYETFRIHIEERDDVPGEKDRRVLFHIANLETDLEGCIGIAESFGKLRGTIAVLNSGDAFREFMGLTKGLDQFYMEVIRA